MKRAECAADCHRCLAVVAPAVADVDRLAGNISPCSSAKFPQHFQSSTTYFSVIIITQLGGRIDKAHNQYATKIRFDRPHKLPGIVLGAVFAQVSSTLDF